MNKKCTWITLLPEFFSGREGDEGEPQGDSEGESGNDSNGDSQAAGSEREEPKEKESEGDDDLTGLKSALDKERRNNKAKDKELARLKKKDEDAELAKKDEVEQANIKAQRAEEKATKLAAGLLKREVNSAIAEAARELGFIDTDDAIAGVDWDSLEYEQDDDDPSDITIDTAALKKAVKSVATKKPHFLKSGTDDGEPTGGQFGGKSNKKKSTDEVLKGKYSALSN